MGGGEQVIVNDAALFSFSRSRLIQEITAAIQSQQPPRVLIHFLLPRQSRADEDLGGLGGVGCGGVGLGGGWRRLLGGCRPVGKQLNFLNAP